MDIDGPLTDRVQNPRYNKLKEDYTKCVLKAHDPTVPVQDTCTTNKEKERKALESEAQKFLSTDHIRWRTKSRVQDVIRKNIQDREEWDVFSAQEAFNWVEKYACNLYQQPWRREFKVFKFYAGFYQVYVVPSMGTSLSIFKMMGYREAGKNILKLSDPPNLDHIATVAFECFLAAVECNILWQIYYLVSQYSISLREVLQCRLTNPTNVENSERWIISHCSLLGPKRSSLYSEKYMEEDKEKYIQSGARPKEYKGATKNRPLSREEVTPVPIAPVTSHVARVRPSLQGHNHKKSSSGDSGYISQGHSRNASGGITFQDNSAARAIAADAFYNDGHISEHLAVSQRRQTGQVADVTEEGSHTYATLEDHVRESLRIVMEGTDTKDQEQEQAQRTDHQVQRIESSRHHSSLSPTSSTSGTVLVQRRLPSSQTYHGHLETYDNVNVRTSSQRLSDPCHVEARRVQHLSLNAIHDQVVADGCLSPDDPSDSEPEFDTVKRRPPSVTTEPRDVGASSQSKVEQWRKQSDESSSGNKFESERKSPPRTSAEGSNSGDMDLGYGNTSAGRSAVSPAGSSSEFTRKNRASMYDNVNSNDPDIPEVDRIVTSQSHGHLGLMDRTGDGSDFSDSYESRRITRGATVADGLPREARGPGNGHEEGLLGTQSRVITKSFPRVAGSDEIWQCATCTYANTMDVDVCKICNKSKDDGSDVIIPPSGRQCGKCTLINKPEASTCEACDEDLSNAATYIH